MKSITLTKNKKGFSLLEVIVIVAIIGIVSAIAFPTISSWTNKRKADVDIQTLRSLVDYAKQTSMTQGKSIILYSSSGGVDVYVTQSNDIRSCGIGSSYIRDTEYQTQIKFESTVRTKHNASGQSPSPNYNNSTGRICFLQDGTSSGGGFTATHDNESYKLEIWQTSFSELTRYVNNQWIDVN